MTGSRPDEAPEVESRLLRTLYELSTSAARTLDPAELVRLVAERAGELLQGDAVALYLADDAAGLLVPVYTNDARQTSQDEPLRPGEGAAGQAMLQRHSVLVDDYAHYEHAVAWFVAHDLKSVEAVPLLVGDRPIGALVVRFYSQPRAFGEEEERILMLLAAQVAPALEAARLYATSSLGRQHERALREITQALAVNLDERKVLELAVRYGGSLLRAPYARVWLVLPNGELSCAAAEGYVHADTFKRRLPADSTSGRAARQQILGLGNAPAESNWEQNPHFGEQTGLGAYLGAGLWRAGESLGVLEVMRQAGRRFSEVEEQLLLSLANAVAVAVSNARTHQAVTRSELLLRSIYEAIGAGVLVFDEAGEVITANASAAEILGRSVDELLRMESHDFPPNIAEDGSAMRAEDRPFQRALRTGQAVRKAVFGLHLPDGQRRWLQADAVPLLSREGEVTRVISSFIDITDAKRTEAALRQRDAILEAVAFAAEHLLRTAEWEHGIDDVLPALGAATGVSRVYFVPADQGDDGPDRARPHEWTAAGIAPRTVLPTKESFLYASGLGRWESVLRRGGLIRGPLASFPVSEQKILAFHGVCSIVVVPVFAGPTWCGFIGFDDCLEEREWPGNAVEVLKTAAGTLGAAILRQRVEGERLDLVREQSARAAAEAAQRRLAFLAEASQILAASLDYEINLQGVADLVVQGVADCCLVHLRDADAASINRLAVAAAQPYAQAMAEADSLHMDPSADHPVAEVMRTGRPLLAARLAERTRNTFGGAFVSGLIVPLVTRSGIAGTITWLAAPERPPYGATDLSLAQDLARRCALAFDNARLYRESRVAVSIRDEFMSVAAHELKTPMTSLRGYAQLLGREFDKVGIANPERVRRAATTIQVQSDKLARLVGQLLDISRIQSGKLAIERRPADLSTLVSDVAEGVRNQLKGHTLVVEVPPELPMLIDPLRIEQVVTNLMDNAIKYSPEGGHIEVGVVETAPNSVQITVRDRGVGVPMEHRPHIFDRFYQAHAGGALTSMAGMGLGLYISRQIVELHGGTIAAEFPEDGGTRFVVVLPR